MIWLGLIALALAALLWLLFFRRTDGKTHMGVWRVRYSSRWQGDMVSKQCDTCQGSGEIGLIDRKPIKRYEVNANAIDCPGPCNGMGWYWARKGSE